MNQNEPHKIIRCLAEGVDPITLDPLPLDSPLQQPYLIRAFSAASSALDSAKERELRRLSLPQGSVEK
jgi:hypothetical protein